MQYFLGRAKVFNRKANEVEEVKFLHLVDNSRYPAIALPKIRAEKGVGRPKAKRTVADDCEHWIKQCDQVNAMYKNWLDRRNAAVAQR